MKELKYTPDDFYIGSTEGGETPWVIGCTEYAAEVSNINPYYLYCNEDDVLIKNVERSRRVI
jgi:N-acetylmuramic acid 6-phosphate etherase